MKLIQLDELKSHLGKIQKRFKQATIPTHFLANMINPKYMAQRLSCEQQEEARCLLIQLNASLLPQLYQFQAKEAPFPASIFECTDALDPVTWWKAIKKSKNLVADEFCDIAINLLILPSSSASIERIFSNFGLIQTELRTRLGIDKASKLVACYRELRGCQELKW
ncbi:Transposase [Oopsacas minuta]|uniref:Transposase n=1 Tax=Oopsacas minuta TaxID=111878 RepID=A0AAV7JSM4_9METZ|nr:Transposase [Oopsacas minuta]